MRAHPRRPEEMAEPEPEPEPEVEMEPLFGAFDPLDGGLGRPVPPALFAAFPLLRVVGRGSSAVETHDVGRSLAAARDVAAGEELLVAAPWASAVLTEQRKHICACCHGKLPVCNSRVGKKGKAKNSRKKKSRQHGEEDGVGQAEEAASSCACGEHRYCSQRCRDDTGAAWHRQWACSGVKSISADRNCSQHAKTIARLVLETVVRGACPRESGGSAGHHGSDDGGSGRGIGASWTDGVMLLQSHVAHHSDGQAEDDDTVQELVRAALAAQAETTPSLPPSLAAVPPEMVKALISCVQCNNFGIHDGDRAEVGKKQIALALYPGAALINHACRANVVRSFDAQHNMILTAAEPVAQGQALNIMYGSLQDTCWEERQQILREGHFFECRCERCLEECPAASSALDAAVST